MKVSVQSVNFNIDNELIKFIEKKVNNLEKFHDNILGAEVFLKVEKSSNKKNKITEIKISLPGNDLVVKKQNKSFEEGVSMAVDTIKRQLLKRKEKLRA
jgi:putative sigma-54 modulation protein